ncbi:MAG: type IVB secretion system apparatus protein IcmL/DotI [Gammaproteobacteria bacterium]|nr:type IVB secretion system apparatus protein IcmL/DotI [Gammaproteobacteria bacterium]MCD8542398.1 type IVB secretion system apparatus protein IcmL/DotI [Gammaproteobacteria bacterium]
MADESLELIRLRNNFYRDNYRRVMKLLLIMSIVMVILVLILAYLFTHRPEPRYFATTQSGRILRLIPLNQPMLSSEALLSWASQVAMSAYTYNFANYRQKIQTQEINFTGDAWQQFLQQLKDSGNIQAVDQRKINVNAVVSGSPVIVYQGMLKGRYAWKVQVPLLVTFVSASDRFQKNYMVTMVIVRVSTVQNQNGVAVAQFVVSG